MKNLRNIAVLGIYLLSAGVPGQAKRFCPPDPIEEAKNTEFIRQLNEGQRLVRLGRLADAIPAFERAYLVEKTLMGRFGAGAKRYLAQLCLKLGNRENAIVAFRNVYRWTQSRGDLEIGAGEIPDVMDYAMLLAQDGKSEEAKAMYYFGLRNINHGSRSREPFPFLVVFDQEPDAVVWEYTTQRLTAAASMVKAMYSSDEREPLKKAKDLAPDWFYPVLWSVRSSWKPEHLAVLDRAEALATPGLEKRLVAQYRVELAEHRAAVEASEYTNFPDERPMSVGVERRARMRCLRPNEEILRRISLGGSG